MEYSFLEVTTGSDNVLVGCVYNPEKSYFYDIKKVLDLYSTIYENIEITFDIVVKQIKLYGISEQNDTNLVNGEMTR